MTEPLDSDKIGRILAQAGEALPGGLHLFDSIDSTNAWAMRHVREGAAAPFACLAETQTQGRGRRGRRWVSPPRSNIYLSLAWPFTHPLDELGALPIVIGKAIADVISAAGIENVVQKWPNDVLVGGRKIAGVLIESTTAGASSSTALIGIGLNWSMPDGIEIDTDSGWTDIASCLHRSGSLPAPGRNSLAAALVRDCMCCCRRYENTGASILTATPGFRDLFSGQQVSLSLENGEQVNGLTLGLTAGGELRVRVDAAERVFSSADVSLRPG